MKCNLRTIYKAAQLINHPFDAFKLLIQGSQLAGATKIHIDYGYYNDKPMFSITDNSKRLARTEF